MTATTISRQLLSLRIAYVGIWIAGAVWTLLSELDILPTEYLAHTPTADYAVSLASIITAIVGTYLALRLMAFKAIRRRLQDTAGNEADNSRLYVRLATARLGVMALALWTNAVLYYATAYVGSTRYCLLIAMIAAVFCWPSEGEQRSLSSVGGINEKEG